MMYVVFLCACILLAKINKITFICACMRPIIFCCMEKIFSDKSGLLLKTVIIILYLCNSL